MTDKENRSHADRKYTSIASELTNSISTDLAQVLGPALSIVTKSLEQCSKLMYTSGISVLQDYIKQYDKLMQSRIISQIGKDSLSSALSSVSCLNKIASSSAGILSSSVNFKAASSSVADMVSVLEELNDSECFSEDDFVTCDANSIKEWNVPDTIAIPIGHNRIRMKTELFISVLLTIIFGLASFIQVEWHEQKSLESEQNYQESKLQLDKERNQTLYDFLNSIDLSTTSQSASINALVDSIEALTEALQSSEAIHQDSDSTPDPDQESHNSNHE